MDALLCRTVCKVLAHATAAFQRLLARASAILADSNTRIVRLRALHVAASQKLLAIHARATLLHLDIVFADVLLSGASYST
jgi:hypothetical protein